MAYPTSEQADVMLQLGALHGVPDRAQIEPYGIIWLHYAAAGDLPMARNLFIKPDGGRLSWDQLPGPR